MVDFKTFENFLNRALQILGCFQRNSMATNFDSKLNISHEQGFGNSAAQGVFR